MSIIVCKQIMPEIPKIIHQTGPTDKTKWHPMWEKWSESWKIHFPDFEYKLWTDEMMDHFMKTEFPVFYKSHYIKYPKHIQRVDVWRYFCLYKYGGIYADLDFECFSNFSKNLKHDKVNIAESPYKPYEQFQNALMISPPKHKFWLYIFQDLTNQSIRREIHFHDVLNTTGPILIHRCVSKAPKDSIHALPSEKYSGERGVIQKDSFAHHHGTNMWS
jgi:mannosyltransferase OCH1-like enzyme